MSSVLSRPSALLRILIWRIVRSGADRSVFSATSRVSHSITSGSYSP